MKKNEKILENIYNQYQTINAGLDFSAIYKSHRGILLKSINKQTEKQLCVLEDLATILNLFRYGKSTTQFSEFSARIYEQPGIIQDYLPERLTKSEIYVFFKSYFSALKYSLTDPQFSFSFIGSCLPIKFRYGLSSNYKNDCFDYVTNKDTKLSSIIKFKGNDFVLRFALKYEEKRPAILPRFYEVIQRLNSFDSSYFDGKNKEDFFAFLSVCGFRWDMIDLLWQSITESVLQQEKSKMVREKEIMLKASVVPNGEYDRKISEDFARIKNLEKTYKKYYAYLDLQSMLPTSKCTVSILAQLEKEIPQTNFFYILDRMYENCTYWTFYFSYLQYRLSISMDEADRQEMERRLEMLRSKMLSTKDKNKKRLKM